MTLTLDPKKSALVVIDLQKGILGLQGKPLSTETVLKNSVALADAFRAAGGFVVLVNVGGAKDNRDMLRPVTDAPAPAAAGGRPADWMELADVLGPHPSDHLVTKHQWGAFYGTDLDLQLRRRGIETIVLCGISTNIGVETTAREAFQHNYQQVFVTDAMTALSSEEHEHTLKYIFPRIGRLRTTEQVVAALQ